MSSKKKYIIIGGIVGAAGACAAAPLALAAAGFGSVGITAGSLAASYMSSVGTVAAGGTFATLQSAGMAGMGALGYGLATAFGAIGGGIAAAATSSKKKFSREDVERAFKEYDSDNTGTLSFKELKNLIQIDLGYDITEEKILNVYKVVIKKENYEPITLQELLMMLGIK